MKTKLTAVVFYRFSAFLLTFIGCLLWPNAQVFAQVTPKNDVNISNQPTAAFPNDPRYQNQEQYALDLINVQAAWEYTFGDPNLAVALIDTGIDAAHPELADHIHPAARSFFNQTSETDESGHGTRTAGIIAAALHNQEGIAGIAPNVQILPIKVNPGSLRQMAAPDYGFAEPIRYAANPELGVRVMNINFATSVEDAQERTAIEEALGNGVLVVAAAGNSGAQISLFPAVYDCVLGVGAVNAQSKRATFSTYGLGVDLVAPGVSILSTALTRDHSYNLGSGTSYATPHVTGVAALIFSARPDLTAWDVREILLRSTRDLGKPGFDMEYGYGLLDAGAALRLASQWRAGTGKELTHCTGERQRVFGSLYFDQNQNGVRDSVEPTYAEPYTNTTTLVELYAQNGARLLDKTAPNQNGIFVFDLVYQNGDAPYLLKLNQSTVVSHTLQFTGTFSGPYDFDMSAVISHGVSIQGTLFVDKNGNEVIDANEPLYTQRPAHPIVMGLFDTVAGQPLATVAGDQAGAFRFTLAPMTQTATYLLKALPTQGGPVATTIYTITVTPEQRAYGPYGVAVDAATLPLDGQTNQPNQAPTALQAVKRSDHYVLTWQAAPYLRNDSIYEVGYLPKNGGSYAAVGVTQLGQTTNYTLYDLPRGVYDFVVRARTQNPTHSELWSPYSNTIHLEITNGLPTVNIVQLYLPLITMQ